MNSQPAPALPFTIIPQRHKKVRLGLITLQSDETIEHEFRQLLFHTPEIVCLHSRITSAEEVTSEKLASMKQHLVTAVSLFPSQSPFHTIGYACTSGTAVIGEDNITQIINSVKPNTAIANPLSALKNAIKTLNIKRLAFISPYIIDVNRHLIDSILHRFPTLSLHPILSFQQKDEHIVAAIEPQSILDAILHATTLHKVDAVFVSCTNLPALSIIPQAEKITSIPILSSNTLLLWQMLQLARQNSTALAPMGGRIFNVSTF